MIVNVIHLSIALLTVLVTIKDSGRERFFIILRTASLPAPEGPESTITSGD
jgi:hypothetical protein